MMTTLRTFVNLWTLWDHPGRGAAEWALPQKASAIAKAGFDGVMGEPGQGIRALAVKNGLRFIAFSRLNARHDFHDVLTHCHHEGAVVLQVHLGWHDIPADEALEMVLRLDVASRKAGVEAVIETHRDTCTETSEKTEALQRGFRNASGGRDLLLLLDFSHHAVVKHLDPPFAPRLLTNHDLIRRTRWHHLRPFNGHHAQIPVLAPDGSIALEMTEWLAFADEILQLLRNSPLPEIWICPEIGPVRGGYGLSAFPPSWGQALTLLVLLKLSWERNIITQTSASLIRGRIPILAGAQIPFDSKPTPRIRRHR